MESDAARAENRRQLDELADQITELSGHLNSANYRLLSLIAEFDRRKGWSDSATQSCAHWLNWKCGIDMGAAREKVRVAHALQKLPRISAAMQKGQLSYSKVRAMTRVVACDSTEKYLLDIALQGTAAHVEKLVRYLRGAQEAEEVSREAQQQANRYLSYQWDADGSLIIKASLPAESGAVFLKSLQTATEEIPLAGVEEEKSKVRRPHSQRRADALTVMAESFMKDGASALTGADRQLIHVHVSAETLRDKTAGCCEVEDGPGVSAETSRRLACDASIVAIVENEKGEPLNVGRKTRTISPALRRALNARDKGCRFPGCSNTKFVDAHHVHHWANGGETKPSNLVTLCRFHHRKVHEGGVRIEVLDDGAFRFVKPDGTALVSSVSADSSNGDWEQLPVQHRDAGIEINKKTAATRWAGERMDYGLAVEVLLHMERNAKKAGLGSRDIQRWVGIASGERH